MWSHRRALAVGAVMAVAACGGLRAGTNRPRAVARNDRVAAAAQLPVREPARAATPTTPPAARSPSPAVEPEPIPADAWATDHAQRLERDRDFDAEFPLHGLAFHMQAQIFASADAKSAVIGYMRRGARFRATESTRGVGCAGRWYGLPEGGFVCTGLGFIVASSAPSFEPVPSAPAADDGLPYRYAKVLASNVPQYFRPPSAREDATSRAFIAALPPGSTLLGAAQPVEGGTALPLEPLTLPDPLRTVMQPGFYVSLDETPGTEADASEFVRTVRGAAVPGAALTDVAARVAPGVILGGELQLPLAFVHRPRAKIEQADHAQADTAASLPRLAATAIDPRSVSTAEWLTARDGRRVRRADVRIAAAAKRPALVPAGARWIHVRLSEQVLVAYEGNRAVFATLTASGQEGFETPTGLFRIHAKHLSTTMDGSAGNDEVYSIEDVPWTMYFDGNYALHGAFWHDRFGQVRSHGCVNLAPEDARWLFRWTTPWLPAGWHGVVAPTPTIGTWVFIEA